MGMAMPSVRPKWDREHTVEVKLDYARFDGTSTRYEVLSAAPSIWVCKDCRRGETLCTCAWRRA